MHVETLRENLRKKHIVGKRKGNGSRARWLIHIDELNNYLERS